MIKHYTFNKDLAFSSIVIKAILNDERLKRLYGILNELHAKVIYKGIQISEREFKIIYEDEFNKIVAKIYQEINFRQKQIEQDESIIYENNRKHSENICK